MSDRNVKHATFTLERVYPVKPAEVFAAWADPKSKQQWFTGPGFSYEQDFRVGGNEVTTGRPESGGPELTFAATFHDIVPDERIVFTAVMLADGTPVSLSTTTVELAEADGGTTLVLTEQGTFLDDHEKPEWREHGTGDWLDKLGGFLR